MGRGTRAMFALCLALFPLTFIVFAGTDIHPGVSGGPAQQIQDVAAASDRWRLVHAALTGASLLGLGTVLILGYLISRGRSGIAGLLARAASAIGVVGAALLSGVVFMEVGLVAPLAEACASSEACLSPGAGTLTREIADLGWADIPPLGWAGGTLAFGILSLSVIGWILGPLRIWEGPMLAASAIGIYFTNTGWHGDAIYPLLFMLVAMIGLSIRLIRAGELRRPSPLPKPIATGIP